MTPTGMPRRAAVAILCGYAAAFSVPIPAADPAPTIRWVPVTVAPDGKPPGYVLFQNDCSVCHGRGPARPGTRALRTKYAGKLPALLEERTDLTPELIKSIVRRGVSVMPPFRKTELSNADLESIVAYLTRQRH